MNTLGVTKTIYNARSLVERIMADHVVPSRAYSSAMVRFVGFAQWLIVWCLFVHSSAMVRFVASLLIVWCFQCSFSYELSCVDHLAGCIVTRAHMKRPVALTGVSHCA